MAKVELAKYQRQASNKWGFDFTLDKPIKSNKEFEWETIPVKEMPKIYHVINANTRIHHHPSVFEANRANHLDIEYFSGLQNENICPLVDIKKPIIVRRQSLGKRNHQTKITGESIFSFSHKVDFESMNRESLYFLFKSTFSGL